MKITASNAGRSAALKRTRRSGSGQAFTIQAADVSAGAAPPTSAARTNAATAVTPLLALQEVPDAATGRSRAIRKGHDLLDQLERIRHALLLGTISPGQLQRTMRLLKERRDEFDDPNLREVIDEIELRVMVELAKFEYL